ncbi:MAG: PilZ domain-containing protein [Planctomycetes bacterium]|nr:PilZ domain-containing protein [Planctomycetota bacterium]
MIPETNENKRTSLRVGVKNAKAYVENKGGGLLAWFKGKPKPFTIINVSESGLRMLSYEKLNINDEKNFNISIPLLGMKPLNVSAKVVWVEPFAKFQGFLTGMKFSQINSEARERLKHLAKLLGSKVKPEKKIDPNAAKNVKNLSKGCVICQFATKGQYGMGGKFFR